jgi:tRNA (cytidine/uridine-2'-O-)-methyltransferase
LYEAARQLNYEQLQYQPELPVEAQGVFPIEDIYA